MKPQRRTPPIAAQRPEDDWTYFFPLAARVADLRPITALEQIYGYYIPA